MLLTIAFMAAVAAFSIAFFTHDNTFAIVEPIMRRLTPQASPGEVSRLHILARKIGHFLIPAVAYLVLVIGPLRNRRYSALALCAVFAVLDETLQAFTPGRSGSIYDVALDVSGALFSFSSYSAFTYVAKRRQTVLCAVEKLRRLEEVEKLCRLEEEACATAGATARSFTLAARMIKTDPRA